MRELATYRFTPSLNTLEHGVLKQHATQSRSHDCPWTRREGAFAATEEVCLHVCMYVGR